MTRPNAFQAWLNKKTPDLRTELRSLVLGCSTSKIAHQQIRRRGFSGSYDSILHYRNQNKSNSVEAVGLATVSFERRLEKVSEKASDPLEAALRLSGEMNSLCLRLVALLAHYDWEQGGEPLNVRDALKLGAVIPSLSRASSGSLIEILRLREETSTEALIVATFCEIMADAKNTLQDTSPELLPLLGMIIKTTECRLGIDTNRIFLAEKKVDLAERLQGKSD